MAASEDAGEDTKPTTAATGENTDALDPAMVEKQRRDRLEQNRISARESRKRKKTMIEELQRTVITLSKENKELNERNEFLRRELVEIGTKHPGLVQIQALMRGGGLAAAELGGENLLDPSIDVSKSSGEDIPANPQAAMHSQVGLTGASAANAQQQMALMQQMQLQMQALAGMQQNPAMMGMNPALMGMMGMGGMGAAAGQQQTGVGQNSAAAASEQQGQGEAKAN